jgi:diguanylate cyclase (GGDEF)-like protein
VTPTRRLRYAALGGFLGLGAPLGLLALRATSAPEVSTGWLAEEIARDSVAYVYISVSTTLAFTLFGFTLGWQADRLQELARTDMLTGLLNRRAFEDRFEQEFARATRHGLPLSLLLVDVDNLKELNDRAGHRAGDMALQETASALRKGSRISDICARWGGDEFVVLAPGTGRSDAVQLAERIRPDAGSGRPDGLTVSIGVATLDPGRPDGTPYALMSGADAALYAAKALGRDRTIAR